MKVLRLEIRNDSVIIDGYVNAVGRDSKVIRTPGKNFVEQVVPGTFKRALEKANSVPILFNHNKNRQLGSTVTGEVQLKEDNIGLRAHAIITDAEVVEKAKKGELRGWSFGFYNVLDEWESYKDGVERRYLKEIELEEVSLLSVTPAYYGTSVEARDDGYFNEKRGLEFEDIEDLSEKDKETMEEKTVEEVREYRREIEILKLKGGKQ